MKKLMLITTLIVLMGMGGLAQSFEKGSQAINLGIGFGNTNYWDHDYYGFLPSISASYEYGIVGIPMGSKLNGVISIGGYVGASMSYYGPQGYDHKDWRNSNFIIAVRGNYHFIFHDKFDPYAGIALGVNLPRQVYIGDGNEPDFKAPKPKPYGGAYVGARWFFSDNFGVYAEMGWLISVLNVGITFKF